MKCLYNYVFAYLVYQYSCSLIEIYLHRINGTTRPVTQGKKNNKIKKKWGGNDKHQYELN